MVLSRGPDATLCRLPWPYPGRMSRVPATEPLRAGRRLLLDTSSLAYRAFHALPTSITDGNGQPVNAVRGYLDMTARLAADRQPSTVCHVFDDVERPAERLAAFPAYKAERAPQPEGLGPQLELLQQVLAALGHVRAVAPGWEADDAIAALCAPSEQDVGCDVVTGDRDLIQLVRDERHGQPGVRLLFTRKGVSDLLVLDEAAVIDHYGVPASRYADYATLRGDPSDGLPGVPGVGEKTARRLVEAYPDLATLVEDAESQSPALAARLRDARSYLSAMRAVVPARGDVAVTVHHDARDDARLDHLAERHSLESPIRRLRQALAAS